MTKFRVTLNFNVDIHDCDDAWSDRKSIKDKQAAFQRTEKYYEEYVSSDSKSDETLPTFHRMLKNIQNHVKSNNAMEMVEYICCDGEVVSAEWDVEKFAMHLVVDTEETADQLLEDLKMNSLEDGEYEACGETGWILFTRNSDGSIYDGDWNVKDAWEFGLVDYRSNPIEITTLD